MHLLLIRHPYLHAFTASMRNMPSPPCPLSLHKLYPCKTLVLTTTVTSGPSQQPAVAPLCAAVALARAVDLSDTNNNNKPHTLRCCPGSQVERHTSVIAFAYSLQIRAIPKLACA